MMMTTNMVRLTAALLLLVSSCSVWAMTDPATKIAFPPVRNGLDIFGVGVRKKGPIKIYSVALYCEAALKAKLAALSGSKAQKQALEALQSGAKDMDSCFLLEMSMKVGAEKIASGIAKSVEPRHGGAMSDVDELKTLILDGVGGVAKKGTQLEFQCSKKNGVNVAVNGQDKGSVDSPELAKAFCDVYLDSKGVSPALLKSCVENCCAP